MEKFLDFSASKTSHFCGILIAKLSLSTVSNRVYHSVYYTRTKIPVKPQLILAIFPTHRDYTRTKNPVKHKKRFGPSLCEGKKW